MTTPVVNAKTLFLKSFLVEFRGPCLCCAVLCEVSRAGRVCVCPVCISITGRARGRVGCSEVDLETFYIVRFFSDLLSGIFLRNLGTTFVLSNCARVMHATISERQWVKRRLVN